MYLWKTPGRLRRIALLLFVAFPLVFISSLLARRMPWWQWEAQLEGKYWLTGFFALSATYLGLLRTHRWALFLVGASSTLYTVFCLFLSVRQENVGLGLFAVVFGISVFGYLDRLWSAYQTPAVSPGMSWYQSVPETIPGLALDWGDLKDLRLSKLNLDGGFVVGNFPKGSEKNLPGEMTLLYRGSKTSCAVALIAALESKIDSSWAGIGVEFKKTDRDSRKDLADFIEVLRGEGHVSS